MNCRWNQWGYGYTITLTASSAPRSSWVRVQVRGGEIVGELFDGPGSDDHRADLGSREQPVDRDLRDGDATRLRDVPALVDDRPRVVEVDGPDAEVAYDRAPGPVRRRFVAVELAAEEPAGERAPHEHADALVTTHGEDVPLELARATRL